MTRIKICGLTRAEDALLAAGLGADFLGFIFVPSSERLVGPERAAEIARAVRNEYPEVKLVGVFSDQRIERITEVAGRVGLDLVQLHGNETNDDIRALGIPAIKSLRVGSTLPDARVFRNAAALLFDTLDERRAGGTGRRFEWSLLTLYPRTQPFFLAGGLTPDNVAAAIALVRPDAIDVASGVESSPGVKDEAKLRALIQQVRNHDKTS